MDTGDERHQKMAGTLSPGPRLIDREKRYHLEVDGIPWCQQKDKLDRKVDKKCLRYGVGCQYYSRVNALSVAMVVQQELPNHTVEVKDGRCPVLS